MTPAALRHLRHVATVTTPDGDAYTLRTPRTELAPLVVAGYVVTHPTAKDLYRVTAKGLRALLEMEQSA